MGLVLLFDAQTHATDPPSEAEIRKKIQTLGRHESTDFDGLSPALFRYEGTEPPRETQVLFLTVRYSRSRFLSHHYEGLAKWPC